MEDKTDENDQESYLKKSIILRDYQLRLLERIKEGNSIIYLPAGAGKTIITIHVLCSKSEEIRRSFSDGGKRAFFVATTKVLVQQLAKVLNTHTKFTIACLTGDMNVDTWNREKWMSLFENSNVITLTAEILRQILQLKYIRPRDISLIVFDECHHAVENHPYRLVLELCSADSSESPLLLGLTCVLLNSNPKKNQIQKHIKDLETAFKGKIITETSLMQVMSFSAKPIEKLVIYKEFNEVPVDEVVKLYEDVISIMDEMVINSSFVPTVPVGGCDFKNRNRAKRIKNNFVSSKEHFIEFGMFGGCISALSYIILLEKSRLMSEIETEIQACVYAVTELNKIRHTAQKIMGEEETTASIMKFSSHKVRKLINVIRELKEGTPDEEHKSIIIFVHQRATAIVLAFILKRLSQVDSYFSFISVDFIVGTAVFSRQTFLLGTSNEEIIKQFTNRSLNVLVATNVLEEGIDVSDCNVVISFDFPLLYPSYFQSKGRARNSKSLYYLFINERDQLKKVNMLSEYSSIDRELSELIGGEAVLRESEESPFKGIESIALSKILTVDALTAIKAVLRYCSMLPQDKYCILAPCSWYTAVGGTQKIGFLQLPVNSPLRDIIQGEPRCNKIEAKRSVYLVALKRLYDIGELDDHLNIKSFEAKRDFDKIFPNYKTESIDENLPQPGTKRRKQMHKMKFADALSNCMPRPGVKAYVHVIDFKIHFNKPKVRRKQIIYEVLQDPVTFAIISTKKLDKIFQFPLFLGLGRVNCDFLVNYDEIVLNEEEINDIKSCHFALFKKVTSSVKNAHIFDRSNKQHSFFVAPVEMNEEGRFVLCWDLIRSDFCRNSNSTLVRYNPTASREAKKKMRQDAVDSNEWSNSLVPYDTVAGKFLWGVGQSEKGEGPAFTMTEADYKYFIIIPNYRRQDPPQCYIVDKFCRNMSPLSPFPRVEYKNFVSYYEDKYMIKITNERQPLLNVSPLYRCSNFNKPRNRKLERSRDKKKIYEEHLVPELCDVVRFDRRFWLKALLIPTALNRICHVYCVDEFRRKIVRETGLGVCDLPNGTTWQPLEVDYPSLFSKEEEFAASLYPDGLNSVLPLSELKDKTRSQGDVILDPERHLYEYGLCDLEFYVKFLKDFDPDDFQPSFQENTEVIELIGRQSNPVPHLKILSRRKSQNGPELALLVQACTAKSADDMVNLERLETLGDCFLKFAATLYLFRNYPNNEGVLTDVKGKMVGNRNLLYCGLANDVQNALNVLDFVPSSEWTPPLFTVPERLAEGIVKNNVDPAVLFRFEFSQEEQFSGDLSESTLKKNEEILLRYEKSYDLPANPLMPYKVVDDKTISDCVEALIGAYLVDSGVAAAFKFLTWLGVLPKSSTIYSDLMEKQYKMEFFEAVSNAVIMNKLSVIFYSELEDTLNYRFKDKALLLEALTHPSYSKNRLTNCYQRLEFLGDAVLDLLITTYIYEKCDTLTPGQITDVRSSLVNNITFASLVVRYEIHKYMLSFSSSLSKDIENFVTFQQNRDHVIDDNVLILLEENDCSIAESIIVPKALGDIFESLAGAIFLDSGNSLEAVWNVYYVLMEKEIEKFTLIVPKTSVRLLQEICGDKPYYETKALRDGKTQVTCSVYYENREVKAYGFGPNKKEGKRSAAKVVLNEILRLKKGRGGGLGL